MRFDDRLTTLLAASPRGSDDREALWAQLADATAQSGRDPQDSDYVEAIKRLLAWRYDVEPGRRKLVSASLASPRTPAEIVALFASDEPAIAAPMLARANLPDEGWAALIPRLTPASRNLLRGRHDLPFAAQRSLRLFAQADQALGFSGEAQSADDAQPIQIRDLVARIEAYRRTHAAAPDRSETARIDQFRFEAAPDGVITLVAGAPAEALIGLPLSEPAQRFVSGGDDKLRSAIAQKVACDDGRLDIYGSPVVQGRWHIRAHPIASVDGAAAGFRGVATRSEEAPYDASPLVSQLLAPDSVRQLAHELRTPLNAIRGFADLIAGQFFGPAPRNYRDRAAEVAADARLLSDTIGDLDVAARLDAGGVTRGGSGSTDCSALVRRIVNELRATIERRALTLRVTAPTGLPPSRLSDEECEALVRRLLSTTIDVAEEGEALTIEIRAEQGVCVDIARPRRCAGLTTDQLRRGDLATGDGAHQPPLGFGFALRLIEALAQALETRLEVDTASFKLFLPAADMSLHAKAA